MCCPGRDVTEGVCLHEGMQGFKGGKFVTTLYSGMVGGGWFQTGECSGTQCGAHKSVRGNRPPCTNWSGAGAASLMSPRQGETSLSDETGAGGEWLAQRVGAAQDECHAI